jgi:hypothetical protein
MRGPRTGIAIGWLALTMTLAPARLPASPAGSEAEAFVAKADALINNRTYDSAATAHYKVKTDDPRLAPASAAELLEGFRAFFDGYWAGRLELRPYDQVGRIYLFYSRFHYGKLFDEGSRLAADWAVGHYRPFADIVALHTDSVGLGDLPDALVHEAAHQLVQQRLYGPGVEATPWISEGLASYFGNMQRNRKGEFLPDRIGGKDAWIFRKGDAPGRGLGRGAAAAYGRLLRRKEARPLDEMLRMQEMGEFYGEGREERYHASWLLVHFLLHGDEGAHAAGFTRYLAREIREDVTLDDFHKDIGMPPDALQAAFEKHARKQG